MREIMQTTTINMPAADEQYNKRDLMAMMDTCSKLYASTFTRETCKLTAIANGLRSIDNRLDKIERQRR